MGTKITKRAVDALAPGATLWDAEVRGFGVRRRAGAVRSYVVKYRTGGGRQRMVTIGKHGSPWTPDTARTEALDILARVRRGEDPAGERREAREGMTFADVAEAWLTQHVEQNRKPRTVQGYRALLRSHLVPAFGTARADAVTAREVRRLHDRLRDRPHTANRAVAVLSSLYGWAGKRGHVPEGMNPAAGVEKYREEGRERFLSPAEIMRVGEALAAIEADGTNPYAVAAIRLLVLTGARRSEILTMRWAYVDAEAGRANLPDSKTGRKTVYLPPAALEVLAALPRQAGNPHVLPGEREGQPLTEVRGTWDRVREAAGLEGVRLHDLRHSFASIAVGDGMSLPLIGGLLGHRSTATTARYAHLADDPKRAAAAATGGKIAAALRGSGAEVVPLRPVAGGRDAG